MSSILLAKVKFVLMEQAAPAAITIGIEVVRQHLLSIVERRVSHWRWLFLV